MARRMRRGRCRERPGAGLDEARSAMELGCVGEGCQARAVDSAPLHRGRVDKVTVGNYGAVHDRRRTGQRVTTAHAQLASSFAKYEPAMVKLAKGLRAKLRDRLPGLFEVVYVYERQHALVIAYSPTENGYDALCSLALYPRRVKLFFANGPRLSKSDPSRLLQGRGKMVRHVVLNAVADFDRAEIEALMAAALKLAKLRLDPNAKRAVILRADAQKQRARRAAKAARSAASRRTAKSRR
jgi:hypothetical protein